MTITFTVVFNDADLLRAMQADDLRPSQVFLALTPMGNDDPEFFQITEDGKYRCLDKVDPTVKQD